jgi:hypothetical protein
MATIQAPFVITAAVLDNIERRISKERLGPYLSMTKNDREHALRLYAWNTSLSEALYGLLQGFEITLRNTFHEILTAASQRPDWYDVLALTTIDNKNIQKAKDRITLDQKPITPGNVIAELSFGFWASLTGSFYAQTLWDAHLYKSFTVAMKRGTVYHKLDRIRKLRNRIAHHEILIGPNLMNEYSGIVQLTDWICSDTAKWIKSNSTFLERYKLRPDAAKPVAQATP